MLGLSSRDEPVELAVEQAFEQPRFAARFQGQILSRLILKRRDRLWNAKIDRSRRVLQDTTREFFLETL